MAKPSSRTYSRQSQDAARLLGLMIRTARIEHQITVEELAERAGVSRGLVYRAEDGDMGCTIGAVFELASLLGVPLFAPDPTSMPAHLAQAEKTLSLMPRAVHHTRKVVDDEF
ncbi:helix-turn-helix domain-containing protein [Phytobacter sp. V91]|uniref:helix-turn-helix domain-containing protein n=1 Tax=Phytobacter sp. V91 TaxID=3369425 RepID=UPI003F634B04